MTEIVYVYSAHSHVHVGYRREDGEIATFEGCNEDDLDPKTRVVERVLDLLPPQIPKCRRCFPRGEFQGEPVTA
jgi:hypothetical protein